MKNRLQAALVMALFATGASAAIVVNGNFDGSTYVGPNGDIVPTGWTVGPPGSVSDSKVNVESTTNPPTFLGPESGADYVRFQSPSTNGRDCLYQDLTTVGGQQYVVSFWVAITSTSAGNNLGLDVEWDENTANQSQLGNSFYATPSNLGPVNYQQFSFVVKASTNLTRIDFHGIDTNGSILLDNVQIASAPEPLSLVLFASGLLLFRLKRKRIS